MVRSCEYYQQHGKMMPSNRIETRKGEDRMILDQFHRPLKDLRISVTDRCNFRCVYCMPKEIFGPDYKFLPKKELLTFEEIQRLVRLFTACGVTKIRITGGVLVQEINKHQQQVS
jgi:uncharacterized radical SAM superfamily Fe-S cluster-containing enzyme